MKRKHRKRAKQNPLARGHVSAIKTLIEHAQETYPHFESPRGQRDIAAAISALAELDSPAAIGADDLERLIDSTSLAKVVEMLSGIAGEKADHIRTNWQDDRLASRWQRVANRLDKVAGDIRSYRL